jgi:hypothetical protein
MVPRWQIRKSPRSAVAARSALVLARVCISAALGRHRPTIHPSRSGCHQRGLQVAASGEIPMPAIKHVDGDRPDTPDQANPTASSGCPHGEIATTAPWTRKLRSRPMAIRLHGRAWRKVTLSVRPQQIPLRGDPDVDLNDLDFFLRPAGPASCVRGLTSESAGYS